MTQVSITPRFDPCPVAPLPALTVLLSLHRDVLYIAARVQSFST